MSDKSDYLENYYLLHFFDNFDPIYIALFEDNPGEDGSGTEFTAASYDRATVFSGTFTVTNNTATNGSVIQFSESQEIWGTASHAAIYDSLAGGNLLYYGALDSPIEINVNQVFRFQTSSFTITEA
jgi:hypothetical protein